MLKLLGILDIKADLTGAVRSEGDYISFKSAQLTVILWQIKLANYLELLARRP